ncbi:MAG: hypothetical protein J6X55_07755, partial [Victivallales bacterium]|nr:hypothetical protein [Victivallales bacterium]
GYLKHMKSGDLTLLDNEPFETMEWCFCDYCREKFAKRFKMEKVPTASEIRLRHREKWITFRCENTREVTRNYADGLRERLPGLNVLQYDYVIDYTNPQAPMAKFSNVCLDPTMNDAFLQGHLQSYYHFFDLLGFRMMRINHARFKAPYIPMGAISGTAEGYLNKSEALSPSRSRLMVLAAAVNGCNSYWFYRGTADALYLLSFQTALNQIAQLEKEPLWPRLADDETQPKLQFAFRPFGKIALPDGNAIDTPDWKDLATAVQASDGSHSLAAIFNFHEKPLFAEVSSSAFSGPTVIENVLTGEILFNGDAKQLESSVLLSVPAREALFVKVRPATQTDKASIFSREALEAEFKKICADSTTDAFKAMNADGFSIVPEIVDGKPGMAISNENGRFSVSLVNGGIQDWAVKGKTLPGNWGRTHIWLPRSLNSAAYPWKLESQAISKDCAKVCLLLEMDDVVVNKTLQLEKDGSVKVLLDFKNNGPKTISMTPKFSQLLNSPEFFGKDGTPITLTFKETVVEATAGRHDGFSDSLVRDIPAIKHGMYTKVNGTRVNCSFSTPEKGMLFYFWKSASTTECTWEYVWLPSDIESGKSQIYECLLSAF